MRFYRDLYLSKGMENREKGTRLRLKAGAGVVGVYCIAVPLFGSDPLEIINAAFLKQRWYRKSGLLIVGMAETLREAELMSADILMEVHSKQGDYNTRYYFKQERAGRNK